MARSTLKNYMKLKSELSHLRTYGLSKEAHFYSLDLLHMKRVLEIKAVVV